MARALAVVALLAGCADEPAAPGAVIQVIELTPPVAGSDTTLRLDHRLSADVLDALRHGVSVTFRWQLSQRKRRAVLWDSELWSTAGERQISYRSLSQRFTLLDTETGQSTSFRDLAGLLEVLNQATLSLPDAQVDTYFQARAWLVISKLPPALRLSSYLSPQWRMDSGWVVLAGETS